MADRCEHCLVRKDGLEVHAENCPVRGPEILEESEKIKRLLGEYRDRCPCLTDHPCGLCEEANLYLE